MPEKSNHVIDEALRLYDSFGWFVIPTDPGAKKPYFGFTYKQYGDTLPNRNTVAGWSHWHRQEVRLGTRTGAVSGIVVLDVDSQEAHNYIKGKGHPVGPMVQSPREGGGLHLYFKHPGFYVKSTIVLDGVEGLDVRGDWGITVLPPSIDHKSGRGYEWIIPPEDVELPDCPRWLIDILKKQSDFKQPLDVPRVMAGIPEGQRDTELNRLAGKFRQMSIPEDVAIPMIELAATRCVPPLTRAEGRSKVKWAYTHYAPGEDIQPVFRQAEPKEVGVGRLSLRSGKDLMEKEFPPITWAVPNLIPAGTMLFGGAPKLGKSWLALGLCISVATGGQALGTYSVEKGDALYLALEDVERRLQNRASQILKSNLAGSSDLSRWQYTETAGRIDQGLIDDIEKEFVQESPNPRLIVIDTLAAVKPPGAKSRNLYDEDYGAVQELTAMANEKRVAIVLVTHLNQGEHRDQLNRITGSAGLTGGVDGALVLDRVRGEADAVLRAWHRDLEQDVEIALETVEGDRGFWRHMGDAEEYRIGKERREILEVLNNADEPLRPVEIAELLDKKSNTVSQALGRMQREGYVNNPQYGKYVATVEVPTLSNTGHSSHTIIPNPESKSKEGQYDRYDGGYEDEGAEF